VAQNGRARENGVLVCAQRNNATTAPEAWDAVQWGESLRATQRCQAS
jgi:hypothetical protein